MKKIFFLLLKISIGLFLLLFLLSSVVYSLSAYYRKDLVDYFSTSLSEKIVGDLHITDIDFSIFHPFPSFSVGLEGFYVKDSVYKKDVLNAEKIFLQLKLLPLLRKELHVRSIVVQNASFFISKDSTGYSNLSAFRSKYIISKDSTSQLSSSSTMDFNIKSLVLQNVTFVYEDEIKRKRIHLLGKKLRLALKKNDQATTCHLKGTVGSDGLIFNEIKGAFLKEKEFDLDLHLHYHKQDSALTLLPSSVISDGQKYEVQGGTALHSHQHPKILLKISTKETDYDKAIALLDRSIQKKLANFHVTGGLSSQTKLLINTKPGSQPSVRVDFQLHDSHLKVMDFETEHVFLDGSFTNQYDSTLPSSDKNSTLEVPKADFSFYGIQCNVKGRLDNFKETKALIEIKADGPLKFLDHFLDTTKSKFETGDVHINALYHGPLSLKKTKKHELNAKIEGKIRINDGHLKVKNKHLDIAQLKGMAEFNAADLMLPTLSCQLNGNLLELEGTLTNFVPFLLFPDKKAQAELKLHSPRFDMNKLLVKAKTPKKSHKTLEIKPLAKHLEHIAERLELGLKVRIDRLDYKRMSTANADGLVWLDTKALSLKNWKINFASGGKIQMGGKYVFMENNTSEAELNATLSKIDASRIFYDFHDFNQKTVKHDQLEGKIDAKVLLSCKLDESYDPIQSTIHGDMSLLISKGQLKEFEPLRKISQIVFKERDLMHIHFDQISNVFSIRGYELYIKKMNVNSSVMSLFIEGVYSFKDKTDLSIQIPLSNLKARKEDFYQAKETERGNIRLRAKDKDGKVTVSLDLFNKYHKEKKASE